MAFSQWNSGLSQTTSYPESLSCYYSASYRDSTSCSYNYIHPSYSLPYHNYSLPTILESSPQDYYSDYSAAYAYRDYCPPTYINSNSPTYIDSSPPAFAPVPSAPPPSTVASPARPTAHATCLELDKLFADVDLFKVTSLLTDSPAPVPLPTPSTVAPRRAKRPRSDDDLPPAAPSKRRRHQCAECGKSFGHLATLQTHQRTHTGEKPYSCVHCGRSFADRSSRNKHERTHTGARPYRCALCGNTFTQSGNLKRHTRRLHQGAL